MVNISMLSTYMLEEFLSDNNENTTKSASRTHMSHGVSNVDCPMLMTHSEA